MNRSFWRVWTVPIILAILSLVGLIAALVGDGLLDFVSWLTLGIPLVVIGWFVYRPRPAKRRS
ncbi:hypothetical protein ACFQ4C_19410 [Larkinella insperata]|uniref:DUF4175 domain-containing protein n=1 Tax=Larkinella insperata TaxID=332158 RepID=A0ABW3QHL5_9BACT|nr:hypothetical protein [Larkinella insperata]